MTHRLSRALSNRLGRWWVCIFFGLISVLMFTVLVPNGVDTITAKRSIAPRILDEYYLTWTTHQAQALFASLGVEGRQAYRDFYLRLDFWFPVLTLSVFFVSLLSLGFPPGSRHTRLNLLPIGMYFFDMFENLNHFTMAGSYPHLPEVQLAIGPILTFFKYALMTVLPLLALIGFFRQRYQKS